MAPYLMCYFIVILFYIEQKWLFLRNLATILPFVCANFLENLSVLMLWMEVSKWWKISDIPKISIKMRNCKTFYKVETVIPLKEILQSSHNPPPSDSILLNLWNKNFLWEYTEISRHLFSKCFKNAALGPPKMVQCKCFLWHQTETCLLENL